MIRTVIISTDNAGKMFVRLNYEEPERPVVKVLKLGDTTVGVNKHCQPVYVRLENAQKIDATFKKIHSWALHRKTAGPNRKQKRHLEAYCLRMASDLSLAYLLKKKPKRDVEFKLETRVA